MSQDSDRVLLPAKPIVLSAERYRAHEVRLSLDEAREAIRQAAGAPEGSRVYFYNTDDELYSSVYVTWTTDHQDIRAEVDSL